MLLNISTRSSQTLQDQIITQLRARILSGELEPDQTLPSIRALSQNLRVGINTVQRAYEQLLAEELIYARPGKGFFVAPLNEEDKTGVARERFRTALETLVREARQEGLCREDLQQIFDTLTCDDIHRKNTAGDSHGHA